MNNLLLSAVVASVLVTGCGRAALQTPASAGPTRDAVTEQAAAPDAPEAAEGSDVATAPAGEQGKAEATRAPGDYVAFRFSGSFRKAPLTLTQRVVARDGDVLVVDLTLEGGDEPEALRVRMSDAPATRGEIVGAAWIEGGEERPTTLDAYEALMAKTSLAADANEALLDTEPVTIEVGGASIPCQKTSYRVRVGKHAATMRTLQSDAFTWGDVGGEITADDGRVLYRAELIDSGHSDPAQKPQAPTVAQSEYDDE